LPKTTMNSLNKTGQTLRVGLAGIGTVGAGTFNVLLRNQEEIARRAGRDICITTVADLDTARAKELVGEHARVIDDAFALTNDPDVDVVVELIGGYGVAKELVLRAIAGGKHVVTANKALLAVHGNELFAKARQAGVSIVFEASVAGGIPIIKAMREGMAANRIEWVAGIINGTTNFILSEMRDKGLPFAQVLQQAQQLGYAEADPTFDIEGIDAGHKIAILSALAFGTPLQFDAAYIEGITKLESTDITYAEKLGYRIKLLGITSRRNVGQADEGIELRVHPTLIPASKLIANVEGAMNAVWVKGDAVGHTMYYGKGAGAEPTASAVIADLVDLARALDGPIEQRVPALAFQADQMRPVPILPIAQVESAYYLRVQVADEPGVLADITRILADQAISIDAVLQREPLEGEQRTDIVLISHRCIEGAVQKAIAKMQALATVLAPVVLIRLEELN
jgi:homoserine dehydrogenase